MATKLTYTDERIILVDPSDRKIGTIEKVLAHEYGMLHRAFSVFIFHIDDGKVKTLLQQRHPEKYHSGGLWSNACCSHPHPGEKIVQSAQKRLHVEMGISVPLTEVGKFHYIAQFDNGLTENEIDHVLMATFQGKVHINKKEVADYRWVEITALQKDLKANSDQYTPWLQPSLQIAVRSYKKLWQL